MYALYSDWLPSGEEQLVAFKGGTNSETGATCHCHFSEKKPNFHFLMIIGGTQTFNFNGVLYFVKYLVWQVFKMPLPVLVVFVFTVAVVQTTCNFRHNFLRVTSRWYIRDLRQPASVLPSVWCTAVVSRCASCVAAAETAIRDF